MTKNRKRLVITARKGAYTWITNQRMIDFSNNNTLGLAQDHRLQQVLLAHAERYGIGSMASPIVSGSTQAHIQLEQSMAELLGFDRGLCFSSGYSANLALMQLFDSSELTLALDRHIHASFLDGLQTINAKWFRYRDSQFKRACDAIITEGIFSQDGRAAELTQLSSKQIPLIIDDAHGLGVTGPKGLGSLALHGLTQQEVCAAVYPMGKAFGLQGAVILGSHSIIEQLEQNARSWIYSTTLSPAIAGAAFEALNIIQEEEWRRTKLTKSIELFKELAKECGLNLQASNTPIQTVVLNSVDELIQLQNRLLAKGILVGTMRPPSVAKPVIRVVLSCLHEPFMIEQIVQCLSDCYVTA